MYTKVDLKITGLMAMIISILMLLSPNEKLYTAWKT